MKMGKQAFDGEVGWLLSHIARGVYVFCFTSILNIA